MEIRMLKRMCSVYLILTLGSPAWSADTDAPARRRPDGRLPRATQPADTRTLRDLEYAKADGEPLLLDLYLPKDPPAHPIPLVVWIHGGGWRAGDKSRCPAIPLVEHGYVVASIDYRLSTEAKWPAQIYDCKAAIRWLRTHAKEYDYDPQRIGVWGGSAGGHLVAMLGTSGAVKELEGSEGNESISSRVQAVCDWFGPTDLEKLAAAHPNITRNREATNAVALLLGGPIDENKDKARQANPITYISKDDPPFLIMHGDKDPLVPLNQSELLQEALDKAGVSCKLQIVEGAGHAGPGFMTPEVHRMVLSFFDRTLKNAPTAQSERLKHSAKEKIQ
jgi:acetyl esterase/lipase